MLTVRSIVSVSVACGVTLLQTISPTTIHAARAVAPNYDGFTSISCHSGTLCMAVGYTGNTGQFALAAEWKSGSWPAVKQPGLPASHTGRLLAISCPAKKLCIAVGYMKGTTATTDVLIERWNGKTWSRLAGQNPSQYTNELTGVSCWTPSDCMAVGFQEISGGELSLAEQWTGTTWTVLTTQDPTQVTRLNAVSCTASPLACTATGSSYTTLTYFSTLAEQWNGTSWTVQPTPTPKGYGSVLYGVSCIGGAFCSSAGTWEKPAGNVGLVETWNGTIWQHVGTPNPKPGVGPEFHAISCPSASFCTATGDDPRMIKTNVVTQSLVESWTGTNWQITKSPNKKGARASVLIGVSCPTTGKCVAVGYYVIGSSPNSTLVEVWKGSKWALKASPSP